MLPKAALALTFSMAMPAAPAAACHRFHVWHYHHPQHCEVARRVPLALLRPTPARVSSISPAPASRPGNAPDSEKVDVEIVVTPELLRNLAIEALKAQLNGRAL